MFLDQLADFIRTLIGNDLPIDPHGAITSGIEVFGLGETHAGAAVPETLKIDAAAACDRRQETAEGPFARPVNELARLTTDLIHHVDDDVLQVGLVQQGSVAQGVCPCHVSDHRMIPQIEAVPCRLVLRVLDLPEQRDERSL